MTWRTIVIEKGGKLALKNNQLSIQQGEIRYSVPLEDLAVILVQNRETVITTPLLSALAEQGITLITCDGQHLPCGQWLPFGQYSRPLQLLKLQLQVSKAMKKRLWAEVVKRKIRNQAFVLEHLGYKQSSQRLNLFAQKVLSGDSTQQEGHAAMVYFKEVFGHTFCRKQENPINAHLNYAYSVLRSAVARALVQYGWLPQLGIFHCSEVNPFNLADDFIEPFRPLVDLKVWTLWQENQLTEELTPQNKHQLVALLNYEMHFKEQHYSVLAAIDRCIGSLQYAIKSHNAQYLKLPEMQALKEHKYE